MLNSSHHIDSTQGVAENRNSDAATEEYFSPRRGEPAEWWYYNGHVRSNNRRYSFHVAFFRFHAAGFRIGSWLPLRLLGRNVGFAHISLNDHQAGITQFAHRRAYYHHSAIREVRVKNWAIYLDQDQHRLRVGNDECRLSLDLDPTKPIASYGPGGLFKSELPRVSAHCSYPRMTVTGSIHIEGDNQRVDGTAWMDREFGVIGPDQTVAGWVWISIQLDDGRELMIYRVKRRGGKETCLKAAIINQRGDVQILGDTEIEIVPTRSWHSPTTQAEYPVAWIVRVPAEGMTLSVDAIHDQAEFDTRGTTNTIYWEGPASVQGTQHGKSVGGNAFLELVGYDQKRLLGQMDHARRNLSLLGYFANETRFRFLGSSRHKIQHGDSS